jgi:hypothetical protein
MHAHLATAARLPEGWMGARIGRARNNRDMQKPTPAGQALGWVFCVWRYSSIPNPTGGKSATPADARPPQSIGADRGGSNCVRAVQLV